MLGCLLLLGFLGVCLILLLPFTVEGRLAVSTSPVATWRVGIGRWRWSIPSGAAPPDPSSGIQWLRQVPRFRSVFVGEITAAKVHLRVGTGDGMRTALCTASIQAAFTVIPRLVQQNITFRTPLEVAIEPQYSAPGVSGYVWGIIRLRIGYIIAVNIARRLARARR